MKNPSLLPAAFAGGLLGAILVAVPVFLYLGSAQDPGQTPGRTVGPEAPSAAPAPGEDPLLREELTMLADRVEDLSAELDMLRGDLSRRPAPGALDSEQVVLAAAAEQAQFTEEQRAAISDILARAREQEAELRASERAAREEQLVLDRAGRIAEQLALSVGDETALADHLRTEADRRREIIGRGLRPGPPARRVRGAAGLERAEPDRHLRRRPGRADSRGRAQHPGLEPGSGARRSPGWRR